MLYWNETRAFIAVGSNLQPERWVPAALDRLRGDVRFLAVSTFYRTPALSAPGRVDPPFLNGVVAVAVPAKRRKSDLECARELKFDVLRPIEEGLGRLRTEDKFAPRVIDLDLILFGNVVCDEAELRLPDPDIRERNFVAVPLLELAPDLALPSGERLADLPVARDRRGLTRQSGLTKRLRELLR